MNAWLRAHGMALGDGCRHMARQWLATALNLLVIGVALSLPLGLYLAVKNLSGLARQSAPEAELTIFLAAGATPEDVTALASRLKSHTTVGRFRFVPKDKALQDLEKATGLTAIVADLGRNPLPDAFVVTGRTEDAAVLQQFRDEAAQWPGIDLVQLDSVWARQVEATLRAGRITVAILSVILGVALVVVTFNTIRLQILNRQEEIEVSKLIGATNAFIRRPFLYFGLLQGLLGAVLGWVLVTAALNVLERELGVAVSLLSPEATLQRLSPKELGLLVAAGAGLGLAGAWISVAFHLRRLDPR